MRPDLRDLNGCLVHTALGLPHEAELRPVQLEMPVPELELARALAAMKSLSLQEYLLRILHERLAAELERLRGRAHPSRR